jgi:L,D-transpeptidase catalytic domain/Bacterial Ig-like domain
MHRRHTKHLGTWLLGAIVVVAVALGASTFMLFSTHNHTPTAAASPPPTDKHGKPIAEEVLSSSPAPGASGVSPNTMISLTLSQPLAADSPMPKLSPSVAGSWKLASPTNLVFQPTASFVPGATETVIVGTGAAGLEGLDGERTTTKLTVGFHIAQGSVLRLQQLLAELGYLPLDFASSSTRPVSPLDQAVPEVGTFSWRWSNLPGWLTSLWSPGAMTVMTQGAVMQFENNWNLTTDGVPGPQVWADLLKAVKQHKTDPSPYDYVYVQKSPEPENVTVFRDGQSVYNTLANTGIAAAPTPDGTWPVYARYKVTTMSGKNPDGTPYVDPGIPWVSYFHGGDALHGYIRSHYGYPQSLGCVEMPYSNASVVFPYTPLGTLVTVQ